MLLDLQSYDGDAEGKEVESVSVSLFSKRFYLFLEREEGREKEGERNIHVCEQNMYLLPLTPNWGPGL